VFVNVRVLGEGPTYEPSYQRCLVIITYNSEITVAEVREWTMWGQVID
jgi:hypothetical protein